MVVRPTQIFSNVFKAISAAIEYTAIAVQDDQYNCNLLVCTKKISFNHRLCKHVWLLVVAQCLGMTFLYHPADVRTEPCCFTINKRFF